MIAFIDEHREVHGVEPICRVLPIAPSTYRAYAARRAKQARGPRERSSKGWRAEGDPAKPPARARSDAALMIEIRRVFEANFCVYGVRKIWRQLGREAIAVA